MIVESRNTSIQPIKNWIHGFLAAWMNNFETVKNTVIVVKLREFTYKSKSDADETYI